MKKLICLSTVIMFLLTSVLLIASSYAQKGELTEQEKALFKQKVAEVEGWGKDPKIVAWVKQKNASGETLEQVKEKDVKWIATPGIDDFMKSILDNDCSGYVRNFQKKDPVYAEIFVMDKNGALVGLTDKTSDYWQGDEDKHIKTCGIGGTVNGGKGATFIDKIKFDESTQIFSQQISVPVIDSGSGQAIGAITAGVNISLLKKLAR